MENLKLSQSNFSAGEISETLWSRGDIAQYAVGASKMRNVIVEPHGGFRRRPGLRFDAELQRGQADSHVAVASGSGQAFDYTTNGVFASGHFTADNEIFIVRERVGFGSEYRSYFTLTPTIDFGWSADTITILGNLEIGDIIHFCSNQVEVTTESNYDCAYNELLDPVVGSDNIAMFPFSFSVDQTYLLVVTSFRMSIYKEDLTDGIWKLERRMAGPYMGDEILHLQFTQSLSTLVTFSSSHPTFRWVRGDTHDDWTRSYWPFQQVPQVAFDDQYSPGGTHSTAPASVAEDQVDRIVFSDYTATPFEITLFVDSEETVAIEIDDTDAASILASAANLQSALEAMSALEGATVVVAEVTHPEYSITISNINGQEVIIEEGENLYGADPDTLGTIRVIRDTEPKGEVEDAFSERRGYARCGTFFAGRLWIGGCTSLPQSVFSSRSGNYTSFSDRLALADYGINYTMDTDTVAAIYAMYAGRHLAFFTSSAEFYDASSESSVATPETFFTRRTTRRGTKEGLPAIDVQGGLVFVERFGKSILETIYEDSAQSYVTTSLSTLAPHLIDNPVDMGFRPTSSTEDADYLYVVNEGGDLAVFNTLRDQRVNAWSLCSTSGSFRNVAVVDDSSLFAVQRVIDGNTRYFLEHFDDDLYVDSGDSGTTTVSATSGVAHLTNEDCDLLVDGTVQAQVTAASSTAFGKTAATSWQIGLPFPDVSDDSSGFHTWVETLPVDLGPQSPDLRGSRQGVADIILRVYGTSELSVRMDRGTIYPMSFRNLGEVLNTDVPAYTGLVEKRGLQGFSDGAQISIAQTQPLPMQVLGVTKKVTL